MTKLSPYLHFNGNCRQAMEFYKECIGGDLELQSVGESQMEERMPDVPKDKIMHSSLQNNGWVLMVADMMMPETFTQGDNVSLCLVCSSKEEIESLYSKLTADGEIFMPLKEEFFGTCAMF